MQSFSVEILPKDIYGDKIINSNLPKGAKVYIAHLPDTDFSEVVDAAIRVQKHGRQAVPHLAVRKIASLNSLHSDLARLQTAGIDQTLVIAGDAAVTDPVFENTMQFLRTGLLEEHGFTRVGLAGHPEGLAFLSADQSMQVLLEKSAYAAKSPIDFHINTQFTLNTQILTDWEKQIRGAGVDLEVHIGLAGAISSAKLLQYALRCGVGASVKLAAKNPIKMLQLVSKTRPEKIIIEIAKYQLENQNNQFRKIHLFPFGSFAKTVNWAMRISKGEFLLNEEQSDFHLL